MAFRVQNLMVVCKVLPAVALPVRESAARPVLQLVVRSPASEHVHASRRGRDRADIPLEHVLRAFGRPCPFKAVPTPADKVLIAGDTEHVDLPRRRDDSAHGRSDKVAAEILRREKDGAVPFPVLKVVAAATACRCESVNLGQRRRRDRRERNRRDPFGRKGTAEILSRPDRNGDQRVSRPVDEMTVRPYSEHVETSGPRRDDRDSLAGRPPAGGSG